MTEQDVQCQRCGGVGCDACSARHVPQSTAVKWGDAQQYAAEPHANFQGDDVGVMPKVYLLEMNSDPLGSIAAHAAIYSGKVVRSLDEVTDAMRRKAFEDVQKTHLKAPLESVKMHFLIEGVDRAFTHQHVRQRTAMYAQESLRFAVPGRLAEATTLPPTLHGTQRRAGGPPVEGSRDQKQAWRDIWDNAINTTDAAYHMLVESGMPAEEARGLLPTCVATRIHYDTDLRNLSDHAGNRLCTQAQFHWRQVFALIVQAIRGYTPDFEWVGTPESGFGTSQRTALVNEWEDRNRWQFKLLAESALFRPVCYQLNYCPFQASFDRACTIRERVEDLSAHGVSSDKWEHTINNEEWLLNPGAART